MVHVAQAAHQSDTVYPRIVSAETILFWICTVTNTGAETSQGRKLFKGGNYSWKYRICNQFSKVEKRCLELSVLIYIYTVMSTFFVVVSVQHCLQIFSAQECNPYQEYEAKKHPKTVSGYISRYFEPVNVIGKFQVPIGPFWTTKYHSVDPVQTLYVQLNEDYCHNINNFSLVYI